MIGLIHKGSIDSRKLKWSVQVNVLLNICKKYYVTVTLGWHDNRWVFFWHQVYHAQLWKRILNRILNSSQAITPASARTRLTINMHDQSQAWYHDYQTWSWERILNCSQAIRPVSACTRLTIKMHSQSQAWYQCFKAWFLERILNRLQEI